MSNTRKKPNNTNRENVLNELLNELDKESDFETVDIFYGNTADFSQNNIGYTASDIKDESAKALSEVRSSAAKPKRTKKFYFVFALFTIIMAVIGIVSTVLFTVNKINDFTSSSSLKDEYTRFLLPIVANDIAPFENENELSNTAKINCSIWNILLNHDTSSYRLSDTGEFLIPEYDVEYSCREIFGTSAGIIHRTVGSTDMRFSYDSNSHLYRCVKDLRYLNYVPVITEMTQSGGIYTLTVDYYAPSVRFLSENIGIEAEAEKTMIYVISRYDSKNTLVAVQFTSDNVID
ncbi:MAG: hypothetical protein J1F03_03540 [Oscillospiraceae bacterium]|nr:hypothetical protein [Oscillospiraceae bacterium]